MNIVAVRITANPCSRPELVGRVGEMMTECGRHLSGTINHIKLNQDSLSVFVKTHLMPEKITAIFQTGFVDKVSIYSSSSNDLSNNSPSRPSLNLSGSISRWAYTSGAAYPRGIFFGFSLAVSSRLRFEDR